jgi:hypothetical protein
MARWLECPEIAPVWTASTADRPATPTVATEVDGPAPGIGASSVAAQTDAPSVAAHVEAARYQAHDAVSAPQLARRPAVVVPPYPSIPGGRLRAAAWAAAAVCVSAGLVLGAIVFPSPPAAANPPGAVVAPLWPTPLDHGRLGDPGATVRVAEVRHAEVRDAESRDAESRDAESRVGAIRNAAVRDAGPREPLEKVRSSAGVRRPPARSALEPLDIKSSVEPLVRPRVEPRTLAVPALQAVQVTPVDAVEPPAAEHPATAARPAILPPAALSALLRSSSPIAPSELVQAQMMRDGADTATAVIKVCVGADGAVTASSLARSSRASALGDTNRTSRLAALLQHAARSRSRSRCDNTRSPRRRWLEIAVVADRSTCWPSQPRAVPSRVVAGEIPRRAAARPCRASR